MPTKLRPCIHPFSVEGGRGGRPCYHLALHAFALCGEIYQTESLTGALSIPFRQGDGAGQRTRASTTVTGNEQDMSQQERSIEMG